MAVIENDYAAYIQTEAGEYPLRDLGALRTYQREENAGKILTVGSDGIVTPADMDMDETLTDNTKAAPAGVVGELKGDLSQVRTLTIKETTVKHEELIKNELEWTSGYYMAINGNPGPNSLYSYSSMINVKAGDILSVDAPEIYSGFRFVTAYVDGSAVEEKGSASSKKTYTVPEGVTGVILTAETAIVNDENWGIKFTYEKTITSNILDDDIKELKNDVEELQGKVDKDIMPDDIDGVSIIGGNILNDAVETHKGTYASKASNGKIQYNSSADYDTVIVPTKAKKYVVNGSSANLNLRFVVFLEDDKETVIGTELKYVTSFDNTEINAPYVAISYYASQTSILIVSAEGEPTIKTIHVTGNYQFESLEIETSLHVYLPKEICVGVGRTIELYNNLVCLEAEKYHINWLCPVGIAYRRKFSVTGTASNVGTYTLTLRIYDDGMNLVASKTATIKIAENNIASTRNVVPIGDSLTNQKAWEPEVKTLSGGKIAYIGTRQGVTAVYNHEGRSGVDAHWYNADSTYTYDSRYVGNPKVNGESNPFWDGSKFSLSHYIDTQSSTIGVPDAVQILLGTNGMATDPTANVTEIMAIVDSIKAEYPDMPIFVCNTIYRSNQDGYYSTGADGYAPVSDFQFSADVKVMNLQNALADALDGYTNVYIVPLSVCMDRDNDFGQIDTPVNPRLTDVTTHIAKESVHPQSAGYMQMADVMYSSYIVHLS